MTFRQLGLHYILLMLLCPLCAYLWNTQQQLTLASQHISSLAQYATSYLPRQLLIHQLQAERGMTLGFYSGKLTPPPNLALQRWLVDAALRDLQVTIQPGAHVSVQQAGMTSLLHLAQLQSAPTIAVYANTTPAITTKSNTRQSNTAQAGSPQTTSLRGLAELAVDLTQLRQTSHQQSLATLFTKYTDLISELSWSQRLWLSGLEPSVPQVLAHNAHFFSLIEQHATTDDTTRRPEQIIAPASRHMTIAELMQQLHLLVELKEKTGQERALVQLTLATKQLTESRLQSIVVLHDAQHQLLTAYQSAASPFMQAHLTRILQQPLRQRIEQLRQQVRQNQLVADANLWFSLLSQWMDDLLWLEKQQFQQLQQVITQQQNQQRQLDHILTPLIWCLLGVILLTLGRICWWQCHRLRRRMSALGRITLRTSSTAT